MSLALRKGKAALWAFAPTSRKMSLAFQRGKATLQAFTPASRKKLR